MGRLVQIRDVDQTAPERRPRGYFQTGCAECGYYYETRGHNRDAEMRDSIEWVIDHVSEPVKGDPSYVCYGAVVNIVGRGAYSGLNIDIDARTVVLTTLLKGPVRPPLATQFVIGNLPFPEDIHRGQPIVQSKSRAVQVRATQVRTVQVRLC